VRIMRSVALMWLGFIVLLLCIDMMFLTFLPGRKLLPPAYYLLNAAAPLCIVGLSLVRRIAAAHEQALLRLTVLSIAVAPIVIATLTTSPLMPGPLTPASGTLTIRTTPILLLGVTLVAFQYQWRHVVYFNLGTFALTIFCQAITKNGATQSVPFSIGQTAVFMAVGYSMCLIMGRLRAQSQALKQANAQLRRHAGTLESLTISRERNRLARELHDTLAHRLSSLAVQLETTKAYLRVDLDVVEELVATALDSARAGLNETRRALNALRASPLDDLGLALALRELVTSAAEAAQLQLALALPEQLPELDPDVEQCIYRVAQEAVANVAQHAGAGRLSVLLRIEGVALRLTIQDDGIGFRPGQSAMQGHFGLAGMQERAALAGGRLTLTSAPDQGTTVELELSL
jgi:signal transduction histidine kinase